VILVDANILIYAFSRPALDQPSAG